MSRNTLVIDPRMNSGASANSTEALVLSTRVAFLRKSYTLSYKGCYPNPARNMPYEFDECFSMRKMEFAMTRLFLHSSIRITDNLVSETSTARVATLRESTRFVASRTPAHNLTRERVIELLMSLLTFLTYIVKEKCCQGKKEHAYIPNLKNRVLA